MVYVLRYRLIGVAKQSFRIEFFISKIKICKVSILSRLSKIVLLYEKGVSPENAAMWVIVHTLTGMALGSLLADQSYWVLVVAALVLHVVLDVVPHWDYTHKLNAEYWGMADVLLSVSVILIGHTVVGMDWKVIVAATVSAAPDLDVLNALLPIKRRWRIFPSHWKRFPHGSCDKPMGIVIQLYVSAVAVIVVILA